MVIEYGKYREREEERRIEKEREEREDKKREEMARGVGTVLTIIFLVLMCFSLFMTLIFKDTNTNDCDYCLERCKK